MVDEFPCSVPYDPESRQDWRQLRVPAEEYAARLTRVREAMQQANLDGLLVVGTASDPGNVQYLANYRPLFGTTIIVLSLQGQPVVVSDAILHGEPMHSMLWDVLYDDLRPAAQADEPPGSLAEVTAGAMRDLGLAFSRVGIASPSTLPAVHAGDIRRLLDDVEWIDGTAAMLRPRAIKSEHEIRSLRRACEITRVALEAGAEACMPGATERDIARVIQTSLMEQGAERLAFETAVASGPRAGLKHATPTDRKLESGDLVFLDAGADIDGYHADLSRTLSAGQPDAEGEQLLETAREMFRTTLKAVKPGAAVSGLYRAAERVARRSGLLADYMPHGLGHGVGLSLFEQPYLDPGSDSRLEAGMTFALEPMLVRYGLGTGVVEETILVTEDGYEILSGAEW